MDLVGSRNPKLPLEGRRIVVTRTREQAGELVERLRELGAEPVLCPAITINPPESYAALDDALDHLEGYHWIIFTSANTVRIYSERLQLRGGSLSPPAGVRIAAVGSATAAALVEWGIAVDFVPAAFLAGAIAEQIGNVDGQRILLPHGDLARPELAERLRAQGGHVDTIVAYRTVPAPGLAELAERLRAGSIDAITFTSSSTARNFMDGLQAGGLAHTEALDLLAGVAIVCIGPATAQTAHELGLQVASIAREHTIAGMVAALVLWFAAKR